MDFQHYGLDPKGYGAERYPSILGRFSEVVKKTARVVEAARRAGVLVIFVGQAWRKGLIDANVHAPWQADRKASGRVTEGTVDVGFYPPLTPLDGDLTVHKKTVSALTGTDLDRLLQLRGIMTLILTGIATNWVVEGTAREASDRGYRVIILKDCCGALTDEEHEFCFRTIFTWISTISTADEFIASLGE